jgi:vitamin K-dependent gamma-carboxylase
VTTTEAVTENGHAARGEQVFFYGALFTQRDNAWLLAFRALFGATMCISMLRFIAYGWVDRLFVAPRFHFKYWGFGWIPDPSAEQAHVLFWVLALLGACIATGLAFRLTSWAFAVGFGYLQLVDVATYLNHYYLATLLAVLLALSPAGRAASFDALIAAWWARRRGRQYTSVSTAPSAWHMLFRFQVGTVYTFAGLAKAQSDWLLHAQPLRIWLPSHSDMPLLGTLFRHAWSAPVMSWAGFLFDTTISFFMLWRRTRLAAFLVIIVFHTITRTLFPIGMFSLIMVVSALVFFQPRWPRDVYDTLLQWGGRRAEGTAPAQQASGVRADLSVPQRWALVLAGSYALLCLWLPLRYLTYGDGVLWHEQGMRWSWRVMVREKNGSVTFLVREPKSGSEWQVPPRRYLSDLQEREMSTQPDLILQLAHHIRDEYRERVGADVEVRVDAVASLNGRRLVPLIDPNVDLATVDDGLGKASWITAPPSGPPPHLRPL